MKMSKYGEGLIDIHFFHLTESDKNWTIVLSPPGASPGFGTNSAQFYVADLFSNILLRLSVHCAIKFQEGFNWLTKRVPCTGSLHGSSGPAKRVNISDRLKKSSIGKKILELNFLWSKFFHSHIFEKRKASLHTSMEKKKNIFKSQEA